MGTTVARTKGVAGKTRSLQAATQRRESIEPEDASRLSFLAYTIEHYKDVKPADGELQAIVEGLKTPEAQRIAKALCGGKVDTSTASAADVFRFWIKANAKR